MNDTSPTDTDQALTAAREAGIRDALTARRWLQGEGDCDCDSCVLEALGLPRDDAL